VTALAGLPAAVSTTTAGLFYVLAVMAATVGAGFGAGLGASTLSFLALNFFFTPPEHTFSVAKEEDLVALVVFLVVSATVGALLSSALTQGLRAARREREARLLHDLGTRLLAGESAPQVLSTVALGMQDLFGLAECTITSAGANGSNGPHRTDAEVIPMTAGGRTIGTISVVTGPARTPLAEHEREVIRSFAGQIALALESVRLAKEAEEARVEADASKARAALFSSISHDLRTPLASITAAVTSLLGADASMHPVLHQHPVRLILRDDLPEVPLDVILMDQVLTNLLENAAKFSRPGSEIAVQASRWQDVVRVRVADRGVGIPADVRDEVFEPFVRADGDRSRGTGLGLAIAKAIVEGHGGSIWIEGAPGGGTAVVFEVPIRARR
jgi:two-component system sensor histidine kinase KdpD